MRQIVEYRAKDGAVTYRVRYRYGGGQHSQTFRRKAEAKTFAGLLDSSTSAALAWLTGKVTAADVPTFAQHLDAYVNQLTGVQQRTRDDYLAMSRRYLGSIHDLPLTMVTRKHVADIVNALDRQGLSAKTIKNVIHMLSSAMSLALDERLIETNPCRRVRLPERGIDGVEARFLTAEEFSALVNALPAHYRPFVVFLVGTGLRWSEATALQCRHVNLAAGTVRVDQAWKKETGSGGWKLGPPKSRKARRTVNAATMALAAAAPLMGEPGAFLFTTPRGIVIRHNNFYSRVWQPAIVKAGLQTRIHDLRHTHASWLISDGVQLEAVQDQLGHESILTTRGVYGHLQPALGVEVGRSASAALDRALPAGWDASTVPAIG